MKNNLYMYLLKDNVKLLKTIFEEKAKENNVLELIGQFNDNSKFMEMLKNNVSRETLESDI